MLRVTDKMQGETLILGTVIEHLMLEGGALRSNAINFSLISIIYPQNNSGGIC